MKISSLEIISVICAIVLSSCTVHYVPPPVNNPMLSGESELMFNANIAGGNVTISSNINVAYSPIQNIGVGYSYQSLNSTTEIIVNGVSTTYKIHNGFYNEIMGGYYQPFSTHGLLEIYGGGGLGKLNITYIDYGGNTSVDGTSSFNYNRLFIMPAIGTKLKNFHASFGLKIYRLDINNVKYQNVNSNYAIDMLNRIDKSPYYFVDPAVSLKFGHKNLMLFTQLAITDKMSNNIIDYEPFRFTLGLQFQFFTRGPKTLDKSSIKTN